MRVFLIRHGRQSDPRCNVDVDLAPEGREQADLTGKRIQTWGIRRLYSSDMIRARETADIINHTLHVPSGVIPEFRELDFGAMEGLTDEEISQHYGAFQAEQAALHLDLTYPGGGESAGAVLQRTVPVLRELVKAEDGPIAIVTHGVVIRSLACYVTQSPLPRWRMMSSGLENGSITELQWRPDRGVFSLERLNDYAHLEAHPQLLRAAWGVGEN